MSKATLNVIAYAFTSSSYVLDPEGAAVL